MDYQDFVKSTDISNCNLQFYVDGMTEESGEISGIFKRVRRGDYGEQAKEDIDELGLRYILSKYGDVRQDMLKELGDIHWYTSRFIQEIDSTWEEVPPPQENNMENENDEEFDSENLPDGTLIDYESSTSCDKCGGEALIVEQSHMEDGRDCNDWGVITCENEGCLHVHNMEY